MCTVTYLPKGDNEFVLTSNRDENKSRSTHSLEIRSVGNEMVLFPVDPVSGGSWIAVSETNRTACVLNGAFVKHKHQPPYARSRGLVLLDYFRSPGFSQFAENYKFSGIEPFTLIVCEAKGLVEFRWDGDQGFTNQLNTGSAHIWSSSTLYNEQARRNREHWFGDWLADTEDPKVQDSLYFHRFGGNKDLFNGLIMNRENKVQTLSITGIEKKSSFARIHHLDLIQDRVTKQRIDFSADEIMESN